MGTILSRAKAFSDCRDPDDRYSAELAQRRQKFDLVEIRRLFSFVGKEHSFWSEFSVRFVQWKSGSPFADATQEKILRYLSRN